MARTEFEGGIPHSQLTPEDSRKDLQTMYGKFAGSVLYTIQDADPLAPRDIVTFGENWFQLYHSRTEPKNEFERNVAEATRQLNDPSIGPAMFGDMWPIMERPDGFTINHFLASLYAGVESGAIDPRVLQKLAVLDLSDTQPILREDDLPEATDTPWGVNGVFPGTDMMIYHITSGYPRMMVEELSDDSSTLSATFYRFGANKE